MIGPDYADGAAASQLTWIYWDGETLKDICGESEEANNG